MSYRETPDVAKAVIRLVRAIGRRVAVDGNPEYLEELQRVQGALDMAWKDAVDGLRATGFSDSEIGRPLDVTRQAVRQRWPRPQD
jgi:hypothetical protein